LSYFHLPVFDSRSYQLQQINNAELELLKFVFGFFLTFSEKWVYWFWYEVQSPFFPIKLLWFYIFI